MCYMLLIYSPHPLHTDKSSFGLNTVSSVCLTSYTMACGSATTMVQIMTLPLFLCITGLLSETQNSLTLEAEAGDNVTIWCQHDLKLPDTIFWFKHMSDSVPLLLGCKKFFPSASSESCYFFSESERIVMSVHGSKTSLKITAVNVSDTGLYYCSFTEKMIFSNSTYLQLKTGNKTLSISDRSEGSVSPAVFFIMTVVFGSVTVFLLGVLIIILKHRKTHTGDITDGHDDEERDSVNYAALQFSKKKTKKTGRSSEIIYTHVVYSAIRQ
ncbi:uncharacterized protein LOC113638513 [Tachysurus fulvidraco]|uniref:uncharacterized protein LOC113638513 n=1 Tax=Tachysurus fulvidraco TaxID=1234273 RepID=UPI001FEF52A6|nr:uncharacterized protein LOC113638513 [Tachysurus fulvidraco]